MCCPLTESNVLQADALEHALMAALPLGPQSAAGGVSLPDSFAGELQVCMLCHLSANGAICSSDPSLWTCLCPLGYWHSVRMPQMCSMWAVDI